MSDLNATTCYLPNAAKLQPLGYKAVGVDSFGRRIYQNGPCRIAVDCAEGASGEVVIGSALFGKEDIRARGRVFAGLLPSESFFDQLLIAVNFRPYADAQ